jgi:hypothetical protein
MATYVTLTVPVKDIIGELYDPRRTSVWIEANTPNSLIIVDGTSVRVGGRGEKVTAATIDLANLVATNSASNPASFEYRVTIVYTPKGGKAQETLITSTFPLIASKNLAAIDEAWDNVTAPPTWRSAFMDSVVAAAETAAASATSAAASAALADSLIVADLGTSDAQVKTLVESSSSLTSAALSATYADRETAPINALAHASGVLGNGTDETAVIQAVIDSAASLGGPRRVIFPATAGGYRFSTLTVPGGVHLLGDGYTLVAQDPFGSTQYNAGGANRPKGSVLRSTATTGTGITLAGNFDPARLTGLCVVGPGSGTSTGVAFQGSVTTTKHRLDDVMVANFSRCWYMRGPEDSVFINLKARACSVGFELDLACNQNAWIGTEVQFSSDVGILTTDGAANQFIGILLQNMTGQAAIKHVSGEMNNYQGIYHESSGALTNMIHIVAGSYNIVRDLWSSTPMVQSTIAGGGFNKFENWDAGGNFSVVASGGANHIFEFVKGMTLTGAQATNCTVFDETRLKMGPNADVRINAGRKYYFETSGTGSYIGRNNGTGVTEIGTPGAVLSLPAMTSSTTAPAAGGGGALPATPAGYIDVLIAGVARKIPVY